MYLPFEFLFMMKYWIGATLFAFNRNVLAFLHAFERITFPVGSF